MANIYGMGGASENFILNIFKRFKDSNAGQTAAEKMTTEEIIALLDELIPAIKADLMGNMRILSGKTNRLPYAFVWLVCIYEMIVILCLYYKRVIVMIILLLIYPLVAMTYPIDKAGDGKAQSLSRWYKEFTVNIIVQLAHAVVYVVLITAGKEIYAANSNNWLFFILSVLFLFPAERLIRAIFGIQGNTITVLKSSATSIIVGASALTGVAVNTARSADQNIGITKGGREKRDENKKKANEAKTKRDKRDKELRDRANEKERIRKKKAAYRRRNSAYVGKVRRVAYATLNGIGTIRSGMYHVGNVGRTLKGTYRKVQDSKLAKYAGRTWKIARGATGIAYGTTNFISNSGNGNGFGVAYAGATATGRLVGGFKTYGRKVPDNRIMNRQEIGRAVMDAHSQAIESENTTSSSTNEQARGTNNTSSQVANGNNRATNNANVNGARINSNGGMARNVIDNGNVRINTYNTENEKMNDTKA